MGSDIEWFGLYFAIRCSVKLSSDQTKLRWIRVKYLSNY